MIATEGVVSAGLNEGDMRKWIESVTPLARIGKVEEIAAAVVFLPRPTMLPTSPAKRCT